MNCISFYIKINYCCYDLLFLVLYLKWLSVSPVCFVPIQVRLVAHSSQLSDDISLLLVKDTRLFVCSSDQVSWIGIMD